MPFGLVRAGGDGVPVVLRVDGAFPQDDERHGDGSEDLRAEGVQDHEEGGPGVADRRERDEGALPLDAAQRGLVAGLEEVEGSQQGQHDGADGGVVGGEGVGVEDLEEGQDLPEFERDGALAHGFGDETDGEAEVDDQQEEACSVDIREAENCDGCPAGFLTGLVVVASRDIDAHAWLCPYKSGCSGRESDSEHQLREENFDRFQGCFAHGKPLAVIGCIQGPKDCTHQ